MKFLEKKTKHSATHLNVALKEAIPKYVGILFIILLSNNMQAKQVNLTNGLIGDYPFSGNGNDGIIHNGLQLTIDRFGKDNSAYFFDGMNDYISTPDNLALNSANTFSIALYSGIQIGSSWSGDLQCFKGKIDEVRNYNRALNQDEVNSLCLTSNQTVEASFTAPDTVCVNEPITITNTSIGANNYYWNFCVADANIAPEGTNLGNIGGILNGPVYIDYAEDNGKFYGFVTDNHTSKLYRLDFGSSLLNTPTIKDLGNLGVIPTSTEGVQVIKNEGKWYAIIVGGNPATGATSSIAKIEFGTNIANDNPVGTNWGNIGNMSYPHDLYVFRDGSRWYGFAVNTSNSTITRFDFTNSFSNTPSGINLGNIGGLNAPTGVHAIKDNGTWMVFVTNALSNSISRLDFGNSLLNTPTGVNLGDIGGIFHACWDLYIMKFCGSYLGYVINGDGSYGDLIKLDFHDDLKSTPSVVSFGNIGGLSFPHCLSKIFRDGSDLYTLIPNVNNNTISRLRFPGCTNSSVPNSNLKNPPPVTYNAPGTYNINLTTDEGLATQSAICKNVVVVPALEHHPVKNLTFCEGDSLLLSSAYSSQNLWNTGSASNSLYVNTPGIYWVRSTNGGCSNVDSFICRVVKAPFKINLGNDTSICKTDSIILDASNAGSTYLWQNGFTTQKVTADSPGVYSVSVKQNGCVAKDTIVIRELASPSITVTIDTAICEQSSITLNASGGNKYKWYPTSNLSSSTNSETVASPNSTTTYFVEASGENNCVSKDSVTVVVVPKPTFTANSTKPVVCKGDSTTLIATGGDIYSWTPSSSLSNPNSERTLAYPAATTQYQVEITHKICNITDSVFLSIPVKDKPAYTISKSNDIDCVISQSTLTATGGVKYLWTPATGLSDPTLGNPVATINNTTTYNVAITSNEGCVVKDSIQVKVLTDNIENGYLVPNSFTPNGDGKNDCFSVRHWKGIKQFSLSVFSRWGQLIFHSNDTNACWDGKFINVEQATGAYVYFIKAKNFCGDIVRKGTIVLIR
jgi:gliding motility-associated-like protein